MELTEIKGIGPKTKTLLNGLGIYNSDDLISYYPYRYNIIKRSNLSITKQGEDVIIDGLVEAMPSYIRFKGHMDKMTFRINTGSLIITIVIFNRGFLKSKLLPGTKVTIFGKYDILHNTIMASDLRFELLPNIETLEPVYHTTSGITSKQIKSYIDASLEYDFDVIDYIPDYLKDKYNFLDKKESVVAIHNSKDIKVVEKARTLLKYEELFLFMLKINMLKKQNKKHIGIKRNINRDLVNEFISNLPFTLTIDQEKVVEEIYEDLISDKRMNRLLQGDVGSGKTIVSFIAIYINYLSHYQSALMAPTDVLANQHYENIKKIFKDYDIKIGLLTGKLKAKEKKEVYQKLSNHELDIVIGTHALISNDVTYSNLGLVITDEQHRFGVDQRSSLKNKGEMPDILYMSATPIPRTYALTLYGDMDISTIKAMPKGRKSIITTLKKSKDIKDVLALMYQELKLNHQVYVIAPLIEESDKIDLLNIGDLEAKMQLAFGKLFNIGVMHGKMNKADKEDIMAKFYNNEIQILISTTVIEVGVDVANATMIVIFDSFRFGLSTIHQLRGRVGRSSDQSYCVLISDHEIERLNILCETTDGFKISEEDFRLRGSGDLFGVRQSGEMLFKLADLHNDFDLLLKAKEDSATYLEDQNHNKNEKIEEKLRNTTFLG